jgi:hypothetical protein
MHIKYFYTSVINTINFFKFYSEYENWEALQNCEGKNPRIQLKENPRLSPQPHCPNTVRELGLVHDSTGATPTPSLHGPPRGTSILSRSSWAFRQRWPFQQLRAFLQQPQPFKQRRDIVAAGALSHASVALQDAEILQAAAALPAAGVIRLVAVDLQAVESLPQAAGNPTYKQLGPFSKQLWTPFLGHLWSFKQLGPVFEQL